MAVKMFGYDVESNTKNNYTIKQTQCTYTETSKGSSGHCAYFDANVSVTGDYSPYRVTIDYKLYINFDHINKNYFETSGPTGNYQSLTFYLNDPYEHPELGTIRSLNHFNVTATIPSRTDFLLEQGIGSISGPQIMLAFPKEVFDNWPENIIGVNGFIEGQYSCTAPEWPPIPPAKE